MPPTREGRGQGVMIRQGTTDDLLRGCNSTGDQSRSTLAKRCACLPTQQQATHHSAIHGYGCLPDLCPVPPIRLRSRLAGCSPWCRSIRSDGLRGRMLDCRVPSVRGRLVDLLIVARNGSETCHPIHGSCTTVGCILCLGTEHHCLKIGNHHLTDATDSIEGHTPTHATVSTALTPTMGSHTLITITDANVTDSRTGTTGALPQFIGSGIATGKSGDGVGHGGEVVWFFLILQATPRRIRQGVDSSEIGHHLNHGIGIDGRIVPLDPIGSLPQHPTNLPISHATDELDPGGLIGAAVLNTCLSSVVEELIVADPKGSIPGLVICPTVVGVAGHGGEVVWFFLILQATPRRFGRGCATCQTVTR